MAALPGPDRALPALVVSVPGVVQIRPLSLIDAESLWALLRTDSAARFISPPPATVEAFEHFIAWTQGQEAERRHLSFAIVPGDRDRAAGLIQVRFPSEDLGCAEWGFALGERYWGTGLFPATAHLVLRHLFEAVGVQQLQARCVVVNGRGNGALRKLGALKVGIDPAAFARGGERLDETIWYLDAAEWRRVRR